MVCHETERSSLASCRSKNSSRGHDSRVAPASPATKLTPWGRGSSSIADIAVTVDTVACQGMDRNLGPRHLHGTWQPNALPAALFLVVPFVASLTIPIVAPHKHPACHVRCYRHCVARTTCHREEAGPHLRHLDRQRCSISVRSWVRIVPSSATHLDLRRLAYLEVSLVELSVLDCRHRSIARASLQGRDVRWSRQSAWFCEPSFHATSNWFCRASSEERWLTGTCGFRLRPSWPLLPSPQT